MRQPDLSDADFEVVHDSSTTNTFLVKWRFSDRMEFRELTKLYVEPMAHWSSILRPRSWGVTRHAFRPHQKGYWVRGGYASFQRAVTAAKVILRTQEAAYRLGHP